MVAVDAIPVPWGSVDLDNLARNRLRFDANVYSLDALAWKKHITNGDSKPFLDDSFIESATYPGRFKRQYADASVGLPFLLPSQITDLVHRPSKWITGLSPASIEELTVRQGDILLTRSGSVGKSALANKAMARAVTSDDLIRITPKPEYREYLHVFLQSRVGQLLLSANEYGAVIQHIEPHHLEGIPVPVPGAGQLAEITRLIIESESLKERASDAAIRASATLTAALGIPDVQVFIDAASRTTDGVLASSVGLNVLQLRFDASFHDPVPSAIEAWFDTHGVPVQPIGNGSVSKRVVLSARFKRTYVEEDFGVPLIGGKDLGSLDPRNGKFIALAKLSARVQQDLLAEHLQVLVTRSGTIGKIALCPEHWEGWALSEHIIRIEGSDARMAAYIAAWLTTPHGQSLLKRQTYGAVVDEIDAFQVAAVLVPFVSDAVIDEIAAMMLDADSLRSQAARLELEAARIFEVEVLGDLKV